MSKIEKIGNGFIKIGNTIINLTEYADIKNEIIPFIQRENDEMYWIFAQELSKKKDGLGDIRVFATYNKDEESICKSDFKNIQESLKTD